MVEWEGEGEGEEGATFPNSTLRGGRTRTSNPPLITRSEAEWSMCTAVCITAAATATAVSQSLSWPE